MNGRDLLDWLNDEDYGRRLAGVYLSGFLQGQLACEARVKEFSDLLDIPRDLDVPQLIEIVRGVAAKKPEILDLETPTFMYAVFEYTFSVTGDG